MKGNLSMKFYSYDYVLSQISQQNLVMVAITAGLILVTGVLLLRPSKNAMILSFVNSLLFLF